jgi:hypothetical protein
MASVRRARVFSIHFLPTVVAGLRFKLPVAVDHKLFPVPPHGVTRGVDLAYIPENTPREPNRRKEQKLPKPAPVHVGPHVRVG